MQIDTFQPAPVGTVKITSATTTATVLLPEGGMTLELTNADTTNTVFVELGTSAVVAVATTSYPVLPGQSKRVRRASDCSHIATISSAATPILYVSAGNGA